MLDLAGSEQISFDHLAGAVRYRCLDKEGWGKSPKSRRLEGKGNIDVSICIIMFTMNRIVPFNTP